MTLSMPFKAVQGFNAIALHIPIFKENEFYGTIAGLIDLNMLSHTLTNAISPLKFIVSEDNIIFATNISDSLFLSNIDDIVKHMTSDNTISRTYPFTYHSHHFVIHTFGSLSDVADSINNAFRNTVLTYGLFLILFLIFCGILLFGLFETEKETTTELEIALKKEVEALKVYKETQEKLNILNNFIYNTSITMQAEEVVQKFLETIFTLIPKIEKGVLWLAIGNSIMPVASIGYDKEILKNLILDKTYESKLWTKPIIIEKIGISGFPENFRNYARQLGLEEIKETLIIPIIVSDEYAGHLSLDIFKDDVHFGKEDIDLANTVSKIISFYLSIQGALNALKREVDLNALLASKLETIIDFISKASFKETNEEFFSKLLDLTLSLIEEGEMGSVLLRFGNKLKYVASSGYDITLLNKLRIDLEREQQLVEKGKAKIIKSIGIVGLEESEKDLALKIGIDKVRFTITASFFVDEEYYGGVFIDSTKEENPFTSDSIEVMKAVSNLGSLFLRTKKLFEGLENELKIDRIIRGISEHLDFENESSNYMKEAFRLIKVVFDYIEYLKLSVRIEERYIHALLFDDNVRLIRNDTSEFIFDEEKNFETLEKINYEIEKDFIEIGVSKGSETDVDTLNQLELAILPSIKSFFIYKDRSKLFADIMIAFARAIDSKDPYTRLHSENVTKYAYFFGIHLGLDNKALKTLVFAAVLHDVGKIGVSDIILLKNGNLTQEEFSEVKIHPEKGFEIVSAIEGLKEVARVLRHHHERWDGIGYPDGLKEEQIPYLSRILTIVDSFDAMTTDRPYRKAKSIEEAMNEIERNAGLQFDPQLAKKFIELKDKIMDALDFSIEKILTAILRI
ncbi:hypothetical protein CSE_15730 [Caldisericum exile AZM16c01]|uniref:HD-GYP domain-containing protein n=1 Tax=Caldisericum exile (strain DSM 21853 / NBRC 104410 / AZM16c01) TaxID=511051 RepID=A0A7U6GFZ5_CALEA|nr:hypothetical protein CSE_15730 [Caldisericum exile AZM16c01]